MSEPLYLKYRPQKLSELVGQDVIATTLTNAINLNKTAHAYFFTGPRGCGKTSTARILAKSLNCKNGPTVDPCGVCDNCREIALGMSPDVIEIDAASHRSVEDAAQVIERCHLASQTAQYKIYIFDEVHMLSKEAFNSLLKTIEEPPENVVFILATTEEHKVPPTIVSRCQKFSFKPIELIPLVERLKYVAEIEHIKLTEASFTRIAKQSKGGLRDALSILDQISILAAPGETVQEKLILDLFGALSEDALGSFVESLMKRDSVKVLEQTNQFLKDGVDPLQLLRNLVEFAIEKLENSISEPQTTAELIRIIDQFNKTEYALRHANQPIIKLKSSFLGICLNENNNQGESSSIETFIRRIESLEEQLKTLQLKGPVEFIPKETVSPKHNVEEPTQRYAEKPVVVKPQVSPSTVQVQNANTESKANGLVNILLASLTHPPTKALIKDAKVFIISEESSSVVFGVRQKTFYEKLSDARKIQIIKDTLEEQLGKIYSVRFELATNTQEAETQVFGSQDEASLKKNETFVKETEITPQEEETSLDEAPPVINVNPTKEETAKPVQLKGLSENERAIFEVASHILGAKPIKK
jgi:DNA polymerase III subunit gamma/tau